MEQIYSVDKLMSETRRLASEYYQTVGQPLPVSGELAKYDAMRLLGLKPPDQVQSGVDAIGVHLFKDQLIQIKSRVYFREDKSNYRIGELNVESPWTFTILVLFNSAYQPIEIYASSKEDILQALTDREVSSRSKKRGAMSVNQFKVISDLVWSEKF